MDSIFILFCFTLTLYVCMHVLFLLFTTTTATTAITTTQKPQFCKNHVLQKMKNNTKEIKIKKNNSYL